MDTYQDPAANYATVRSTLQDAYKAQVHEVTQPPLTDRIENILNDLISVAGNLYETQDIVISRLFGRAPIAGNSTGSGAMAPESGVFEDRVMTRLTELRCRLNDAAQQASILNSRI